MRFLSVAAMAVVLSGSVSLAPATAFAAFIPLGSNIDFGGTVGGIDGPNIWDSTGVDFHTNGVASIGVDGTIGLNTVGGGLTIFVPGTCPSSSAGGCGTISDLMSYVQNSNTLTAPSLPVAAFVTFTQGANNATFTLTSFAQTTLAPTVLQLGTVILSGAGILTVTGYDPTYAIFTVTAQGNGFTTFSGTIVAQSTPVDAPEPASMLLMGAGLAGLGMVKRRSRRLAA